MRFLPYGALLLALACIAGELTGHRALVYVAKPLATLTILAIALLGSPAISRRYRSLIAMGLAFSLAGDILLMLPSDQFIAGLAAFLVAHVLYIVAFARTGGGVRDTAAGLVVAVFAGVMLAVLWPTLGDLRLPVIAYIAVIATMAWQAIARWRHLRSPDAAFAAAGAALFLISDSALALRKFRGEFVGATVIVLATYWMSQYLIARSVRLDPS